MRIADSMVSTDYLYNLNQTQAGLSKLENQLTTGKAFQAPSDNPLLVSQDMADGTSIAQATTYNATMSVGLAKMNTANQALTSMQSTLTSIRQVVLQAMNTPTSAPAALNGIQQTLVQLVTNLYQNADAQEAGSYVFGGFATKQPVSPYVATSQVTTNLQAASLATPVIGSAGTVNVVGAQGSAAVTIPAGSTLQAVQNAINGVTQETGVTAKTITNSSGLQQLVLSSQTAGQAYGLTASGVTLSSGGPLTVVSSTAGTAPTGANAPVEVAVSNTDQMHVNVNATHIFDQVPQGGSQTLQQTLQSIIDNVGNPSSLQTDLGNLDANISQFDSTVTDLGARINQLTGMQTQMKSFQNITVTHQAAIENADMAQIAVQYQNQLTAYQAALQVGTKIMLPTLANYI